MLDNKMFCQLFSTERGDIIIIIGVFLFVFWGFLFIVVINVHETPITTFLGILKVYFIIVQC